MQLTMADLMFSIDRIGISNRIRLLLVSQQDFLAQRISRVARAGSGLHAIRGRYLVAERPLDIPVDLVAGACESTRPSKLSMSMVFALMLLNDLFATM